MKSRCTESENLPRPRRNAGHTRLRLLTFLVPLTLALVLLAVLTWRRGVQAQRFLGDEIAAETPSLSASASEQPKVAASEIREVISAHDILAAAEGPEGRRDPTDQARDLVAELASRKLADPGATAESITEFRGKLLELLTLDTAAIPALEEYFRTRENVRYDTGGGTNAVGVASLRLALMELLLNMSAPENEALEARLLQTVGDPEEVALLARQLQIGAPGEYREAIVEAAQASLAMARDGRFPGRDIRPLLRVLER